MKTKQWMPLIMAATLGLALTGQAATVTPGSGGYTASMAFKKKDMKGGEAISSFTALPNSWCDPQANPSIPGNTSFDACYGSTLGAKWFLLDLTKLPKQEVKKIRVTITASSQSTTGVVPPAITVFQGYQKEGVWDAWFPNTFQSSPPFWASKLKPFNDSKTGTPAWTTAYSPSRNIGDTTIEAEMKLKSGKKNLNNNYLTVVVGGDIQQLDKIQEVGFNLTVKIAKPAKPCNDDNDDDNDDCDDGGGNNGGGAGGFDACGCPAKTLWHPEMNHCMAIGLCDLPEYKGQCQTGDQCIACSKNGIPQRPKPGGVCP